MRGDVLSLYVLEGLRPWVIQRVSAIYIVLCILYAAYCYITSDVIAYESWKAWLSHPFNNITVGIFVIALLFHAWIGLRDVVLDYVRNTKLRVLILALLIGTLLGCALWAFRILLLLVVA